jgi:hypothetical protein
LVAPGLDGLWAGLFTADFAHFRKAKYRGRVGQRSNDDFDAGLKTIYAGRAGNTTGISNKTRGVLVFGDSTNIAPRRRAGTYTHV